MLDMRMPGPSGLELLQRIKARRPETQVVMLSGFGSIAAGIDAVRAGGRVDVSLEVRPLKFGINRRYLSVTKLRGARFIEGNHDYTIKRGGLVLFPRLVAAEYSVNFEAQTYSSGNAARLARFGRQLVMADLMAPETLPSAVTALLW